jgi:hypothetical protein
MLKKIKEIEYKIIPNCKCKKRVEQYFKGYVKQLLHGIEHSRDVKNQVLCF